MKDSNYLEHACVHILYSIPRRVSQFTPCKSSIQAYLTFARVDLLESEALSSNSLSVRSCRVCASARRIRFLLGATLDDILTMKTRRAQNKTSAIKLVNNEPMAKVKTSRVALVV